MWAYAIWLSGVSDWHKTDDGTIWTTGVLADASTMSKKLTAASKRTHATVLSFYTESA